MMQNVKSTILNTGVNKNNLKGAILMTNYEELTIEELDQLLEEFKVAKKYIESIRRSKLKDDNK